jgi:hypothetical protein
VITYSLVCDSGHDFESWFSRSSAFDEQRERGLLSCPRCGSAKVEKAVMAPRVARKDKRGEAAPEPDKPAPVALLSTEEAEMRAKLRELRNHLTRNSDYVGPRFAEEARKMHLGESDHRSIHGEATAEDAKALMEEGIDFHPLPVIPDERN